MIAVNLLPPHLRPIKRSPLPYIIVAGAWVAAVLFMASVFLGNQARVMAASATLRMHEQELEQLQDVVREHNELQRTKLSLARKLKTIDEIVSDRIIWSRQLYNLSRLIPDNFWYSGIRIEERNMPEQEVTVDKDGKRVVRDVMVPKHVLVVQGYAVRDEETGTDDVYPFMLRTESDPEFSRAFQLETPTFGFDQFEGQPVNQFEFVYIVTADKETGR